MDVAGVVDAYSFWTFSDIFEENYFPSLPFHGGFGLLTLHGIAKPTYRAFELLHRLGDELFLVDGLHETVNCWVVRGKEKITLLLTNHALPGHSIKTEHVIIRLHCAQKPGAAFISRVDEHHANPRRVWEEMESPTYPSAAELDVLDEASRVIPEKQSFKWTNESVTFEINLPPQAVAAIEVEFPHQSGGARR
jgi:xylan 1,4-beta-xylosidase